MSDATTCLYEQR